MNSERKSISQQISYCKSRKSLNSYFINENWIWSSLVMLNIIILNAISVDDSSEISDHYTVCADLRFVKPNSGKGSVFVVGN